MVYDARAQEFSIGVVGNKYFKNLDLVDQVLTNLAAAFGRIKIVSGHAIGTDLRAEDWAKRNGCPCDSRKPKEENKDGYFARNGEIAQRSNFIVAFINGMTYKCGTWNTIKQCTEKKHDNSFIIINELGMPWTFEEYPGWLQKRLRK